MVQRTAAAAGKFDGEWSGLLVPRGDQDKKYCALKKAPFHMLVENNRVTVSGRDDNGEKEFRGQISSDHRIDIWGYWEHSTFTAMWSSAISSAKVSGVFSPSYFKGKFFIKLQSSSCTGDLYLRRGLGFDTAEVSDLIEYGPADPELYKKVKALEKLVEQAAGGARPAPLAVEEDKPATKGDTEIAEIVANPNAPFDGEWKGKFVAESGETPEHGGPQVCLFRETYFTRP